MLHKDQQHLAVTPQHDACWLTILAHESSRAFDLCLTPQRRKAAEPQQYFPAATTNQHLPQCDRSNGAPQRELAVLHLAAWL
jgi:hypothetical protein